MSLGDEEKDVVGILSGIRVLDLTRNVAGPFCTMLLGDLGASVVKVERPGQGDDTREWRPPEWNGWSTTFLGLNRNKRSLALNIESTKGQQIISDLAASADVVVESFRDDASATKRNISYERIRDLNPSVIYCSIRAFDSGEAQKSRPGYDAIIQAASGIMSITGEPGHPPVRVGPSIVDQGTGLWSALAILGALYRRERTGEGTLIRTSLYEVGITWVGYQLVGYLGSGVVPSKLGSKTAMIAPYEAFATKDEYLFLAAPNDQLFRRLCQLLQLDHLGEDARFSTNSQRVQHRDELHELLERSLRQGRATDWEELLSAADIPCSFVRTIDQVAKDHQLQTQDMLQPVELDGLPNLRLVNLPFTMNGERSAHIEPPPSLGAQSDLILTELGYGTEDIRRLRDENIIG